eukprot:3570347-Rhodomonas_salina.3
MQKADTDQFDGSPGSRHQGEVGYPGTQVPVLLILFDFGVPGVQREKVSWPGLDHYPGYPGTRGTGYPAGCSARLVQNPEPARRKIGIAVAGIRRTEIRNVRFSASKAGHAQHGAHDAPVYFSVLLRGYPGNTRNSHMLHDSDGVSRISANRQSWHCQQTHVHRSQPIKSNKTS